MNFPIVLDIAIGLVVIYFISSLIMSFIMEYIIVRRNWRGDFLYERLKDMFYSSQGGYYNIIEKVYRHPLITKAQQYSYRRPENIQSHTFANAFIHVMTEIGEETLLLDSESDEKPAKKSTTSVISQNDLVETALSNNKYLDGDGKRIIESLFLQPNQDAKNPGNTAEDTLTWRMNNIEQWYVDFQLRLDYLFKREVKWYIFVFSLLLCSILNIDTLGIYDKLSKSAKLRDKMVLLGEDLASKSYEEIKKEKDSILRNSMYFMKTELTSQIKKVNIKDTLAIQNFIDQTLDKSLKTLINAQGDLYDGANDLIGWTDSESRDFWKAFYNFKDNISYWLLKISGILISAFALMFGAPFWHEYLKSMLALRKVIQPKGVVK